MRASAAQRELAAALGRRFRHQTFFLGRQKKRLIRIHHLCPKKSRRKDAGYQIHQAGTVSAKTWNSWAVKLS